MPVSPLHRCTQCGTIAEWHYVLVRDSKGPGAASQGGAGLEKSGLTTCGWLPMEPWPATWPPRSASQRAPRRSRRGQGRLMAAAKPKPLTLDLDAADLLRGLHNARLFASRDPYLPVINGVMIESDGETGITFVATDRYTLGVATVKADVGAFKFLMQRRERGPALEALWGPKSGLVTLTIDGPTLTVEPAKGVVRGPQVVVTCTAEDGEFPSYKTLMKSKGEDAPYEPGAPVGLNPKFLARFAQVKPEPGSGHPTMTIAFTSSRHGQDQCGLTALRVD